MGNRTRSLLVRAINFPPHLFGSKRRKEKRQTAQSENPTTKTTVPEADDSPALSKEEQNQLAVDSSSGRERGKRESGQMEQMDWPGDQPRHSSFCCSGPSSSAEGMPLPNPPADSNQQRRAKAVRFGENCEFIGQHAEEADEDSDVEDNVELQKADELLRTMADDGVELGGAQSRHRRQNDPGDSSSGWEEEDAKRVSWDGPSGNNEQREGERPQLVDQLEKTQSELERAQKSVKLLQYQIQEKDQKLSQTTEKMAILEGQQEREAEKEMAKTAQYKRELEAANAKIMTLMEEDDRKQRNIEELRNKLSQALEAAINQNGTEEEQQDGEQQKEQIEELRKEIQKMEQKLKNANEEKDYYKRQFIEGGAQNGHPREEQQFTDDFGKELMMANRRKYQLEGRLRQLELELRETQQKAKQMEESLRNTEKLLWLEKERSATLEKEREQLNWKLGEQRSNEDLLRRELVVARGETTSEGTRSLLDEQQEEQNRLRGEWEQRTNELREMKCKVEWRLGEVSQLYNDSKWRLGEVEATLAHRDWELEQANNRIKQLEDSVMDNEAAKMSDELHRLREEKGKLERRLGEVTQWWNDAKWRVGELDAETAQRSDLLDHAHHRIGELERKMEGAGGQGSEEMERRLAESERAFNDAKWRMGEMEAELGRKQGQIEELGRSMEKQKEEKGKLEWRLGEVTQWWNDAKWRIGELENRLRQREGEMEGQRRTDGEGDRLAKLEWTQDQLRTLLRDGTFLIRKQPKVDRHKWRLLTFEDALADGIPPLRRVWFETDASRSGQVFLIGSFVNWECAILCEPVPGRASRCGIWMDLPPGRYEFRFLRDGEWHTADGFPECWSEHGTRNNWIGVD